MYYPDEKIAVNDVIAVLVRSLGYDVYAEGGSASVYVALGHQLGITDGVLIREGGIATRGQIYSLIANSLEIPVMETDYSPSGATWHQNENKNLLNIYMGIEKTEGILTATELCVADDADAPESGFVRIDGISYECGKNLEGYLGQSCEVYYSQNRETGKRRLVSFVPEGAGIVELDAKKIEGFDKSSMVYTYAGEKKDIRYKLTDDRTTVVYNGSIIRNDVFRHLVPGSGSVRLVDNNTDGYYEYVFIEEYYNLVADKYNASRNILYGRDDLPGSIGENFISLESFDKIIIRTPNRNEMKLTDIAPGSVVSIRASADGSVVFLLVSSANVSGKIQEISYESDIPQITVDGVKYGFATDSRVNTDYITAGRNVVYYLDYYGDIVYAGSALTSLETGYLTDGRADDFKEVYYLRIKNTSSNTLVYRIADKVKMSYCDGMGEVIKTVSARELYDALKGKRNIVLFGYSEVKSEGVNGEEASEYILKEIKLPYNVTGEEELENVRTYPLLKMDYLIANWPGSEGLKSYSTAFNTEYYGFDFWSVFDRNGAAFYVPEQSVQSINPDDILVSRISNIEDDKGFTVYPDGSGKVNSFDIYTIGGHKLRNNLLVVYSASNDSSNVAFEGAASVVADIRCTYDPVAGESLNKVTLIDATGGVKEYHVDDEAMLDASYFSSIKWRGSVPDISPAKKTLSAGDMIKYTVNDATGEITSYVLIYDSENEVLAYNTSVKAVFTAYPVSITETDANVFAYTLENGRKEINAMSGRIVVIDKENETYRIGTASDVTKGDKAFVTGRWGFIQLVVVYKDEA